MSVLCYPVEKFRINPETVNAKGDKSKQEPFYPVSEELRSISVKSKASSVNGAVGNDKIPDHADSPWSGDEKS